LLYRLANLGMVEAFGKVQIEFCNEEKKKKKEKEEFS
jgi:hypothetical protein